MQHRRVPTRRGQAAARGLHWKRHARLSVPFRDAAARRRQAPERGEKAMGERLLRHPLIAIALALLTLSVAGAAYAGCNCTPPPPPCNCAPPTPPPPPATDRVNSAS